MTPGPYDLSVIHDGDGWWRYRVRIDGRLAEGYVRGSRRECLAEARKHITEMMEEEKL